MRLIRVPQLIRVADCSEFVTIGPYSAGATDPNDRGFDGQGYTQTLLNANERCSYRDLEPADLVMFGFTTSASDAFPYGSPTHVAGFDGEGFVYSLGHTGDPTHRPANYRSVNCYVKVDYKRRVT